MYSVSKTCTGQAVKEAQLCWLASLRKNTHKISSGVDGVAGSSNVAGLREHTARPVLPKAPLVPAKALKPRLVLITYDPRKRDTPPSETPITYLGGSFGAVTTRVNTRLGPPLLITRPNPTRGRVATAPKYFRTRFWAKRYII